MTGQPGTMNRRDVAWQSAEVTGWYLSYRHGIPLADVHFDVVRRVVEEHGLEIETLLDLGAGDGIAAFAVTRWQFPERIVLVDFSKPMLDQARDRFEDAPIEMDYIDGDLLGNDWLPMISERGPYDAVISRFAIHHLPHDRKRSLYGEIHDLLRPGGLFINIEHVESASMVYHDAFDRQMVEGIAAATEDELTFQQATDAYHNRGDYETNILAPVWDQCDWLREIGFVDVDCVFKLFELAIFAGKRSGETNPDRAGTKPHSRS